MENIIDRTYYKGIRIVTVLLCFILVGCENNRYPSPTARDSGVVEWTATAQFETPDVFYLTDFIDFPEIPDPDISYGSIYVIENETIFFTTTNYYKQDIQNEHNEFWIWRYYNSIFSLNLNTMEIVQLPNFKASSSSKSIPVTEDAISSFTSIINLHTDKAGNIWITEIVTIEAYEFTEGVDPAEEYENDIHQFFEEYRRILKQHTIIRKLDKTGLDLIEPIIISDIVDFGQENHFFNFISLNTDERGNIYFGLTCLINGNTSDMIYILDFDGNILHSLKSNFNVQPNILKQLSNGNVAFFDFGDTVSSFLFEIDVTTGTWGQTIEIPFTNWNIPVQNREGFIYSQNSILVKTNPDTGTTTELLDWTISGIDREEFVAIDVLNDGRLLLITRSYNDDKQSHEIHIVYLTEISFNDLQDRTLLTIAALQLNRELQAVITEFNRSSSTYMLQIIDYSIYNTGGEDGLIKALDRLTLDITTGKIPDMIVVSANIPLRKYTSMGLLEDLYVFIDNDPTLSRDNFTDGVLKATEINGGLYNLFPRFSILTMIGNPYFLGNNPGWDMDEFRDVLTSNPQADVPMGGWATREGFFSEILYNYVDQFVNWESGRADFNNRTFIRLLESVESLPLDVSGNYNFYHTPELIAENRQIMFNLLFGNFDQYYEYRMLFGGDIVFKGYPSEDGKGNILIPMDGIAMTVTCSDKNGAWEFIRSFLTPQWQRRQFDLGFPVNRVVFEDHLLTSMTEPDHRRFTSGWSGVQAEITALTQDEVDQIKALTTATTNISRYERDLWNIINEEASNFFNGRVMARQAARVIQNRASIFMSEQFW